jgi:hypothetical protein
MPSPAKTLLIGAGELGTAFLPHLSALPNIDLTLGIRTPSKYSQLAGPNVTLTALDLTSPSPELSATIAAYDIVISATGYAQSPGAVTKLAQEVLEAGRLRKQAGKGRLWFFPWQWGVDYDIIGDGEGLMPLFGEQQAIRDLLRAKAAESHVTWTVVMTGIFMSFLFEQFWGIVERNQGRITVRALRDWEHKVTVTDVADIGKVLARILAGDVEAEDRAVHIAGDTVSYAQLADVVERVVARKVEREQWSIADLKTELEKDTENTVKKYRLVFARDGVWWNKEVSINHELQIPCIDVETYARTLFGTT